MDRRIRDHIKDLEQRRDLLNARITEAGDAEQRKQVETELRAVESILKFYRDALGTERRLSRGTNRLCSAHQFIVPPHIQLRIVEPQAASPFASKLAIEVVVQKQVKNTENSNNQDKEKQGLYRPMRLCNEPHVVQRSAVRAGEQFLNSNTSQIEKCLLCDHKWLHSPSEWLRGHVRRYWSSAK